MENNDRFRALVATPMRDDTTVNFAKSFGNYMTQSGFIIDAEGEEVCPDDWEAGDRVMMRWSLWRKSKEDSRLI